MYSKVVSVLIVLSCACASDAGRAGDGGTDPDAAGEEVPCEGTWSEQTSPTDLPLRGVWESSAGDVWMVGGNDLSVALIIDGQDAYPDLVDCCLGGDPLIGVWGSAPANVWAIGNNYYRGSLLRFDGAGFTYTDNLGVFSPDWHFRAIWGADASTVFVVGTFGGIMRKGSGDSWSKMVSGVESELLDVWGTSADSVWAVGVGGVILYWNGITWERQESGVGADLHGVGGSGPNDIWAVGVRGTTLHWDGTRWSSVDSGITRTLRDVWGRSRSCHWAVGDDGLVLQWDGSAWRGVPNPVSGTTTTLRRLWGGQEGVWAVGDDGTSIRLQWNQ